LNFVQGEKCYATGNSCILGARGAWAKNEALECELQGKFDVWIMQDDMLLVTDLGFPADEPKQCLALGINQALALRIAEEESARLETHASTTERKCLSCGMRFWMSDHDSPFGTAETGRSYFCPNCLKAQTEESLVKTLGMLGYWCG
jgi:hypothetical protein